MDRYAIGDYYGQCGTFVNDYLVNLGQDRLFKSDKEQKKSMINYYLYEFDKKWIDGIIAIYDVGTYGHVSIIKVINNKLWVIDANKGGNGLISKREYGQYEYEHVIGFYNPSQTKESIGQYKITSYYTPVQGQKKYLNGSYEADFAVNCSGNCRITADGHYLESEDAFKVVACPPSIEFGTKLYIEEIGIVICHDRGGAIKGKRLDIWAGIGDNAHIGKGTGYKNVFKIIN